MTTISEIREKMESLSEDARFVVWLSLYSSPERAERNALDDIIRDRDPYLKLLLIRFLASVPEEKAVGLLVRTLEDPNSVVQNASIRSFEKNSFDKRWAKLIVPARSLNGTAQFYALEKLAQAIVLDAVPLFLSLLSTKDEKLLIHLLKGFRYFSDERIYAPLIPFLSDAREEVRFRAVMAMGALYEAEVREARKAFLTGLKDPSAKIRRAVLWGLTRKPQQRDLKEIVPVATLDPDPSVREEGVTSLFHFQDEKVVTLLVKILVTEKEKGVLLKAEGVLNGFPKSLLIPTLWKLLRKGEGGVSNRALLILAEFKDPEGEFTKYLLNRIGRSKDPKDIVPIVEAMGVAESRRTVDCLNGYLKGNPLVGYTAMVALLKIWTRHPDAVPIIRHLDDPGISPLFKQTILKQMLKVARWDLYDRGMRDTFLKLLDHENLNIRYLAAQVLAPLPSPQVMEKCLDAVLKEPDPAYSRFLKESLQKQLAAFPTAVAPLVQKNLENGEAIRFLFAIIQETKLLGKELVGLLASILKSPILIHQSPHRQLAATLITSFLIERRLLAADLFAMIEGLPGRSDFLILLAGELRRYPDLEIEMPVKPLQKWFDSESGEARFALVDLAGLSRDLKAIGFLVSVACREELKPFRERAGASLKHLLGRVSREERP